MTENFYSDEEHDIARPVPSAMMESLRSIGYSCSRAIADLIDNSIAAGAKSVWVEFFWNGSESYISITDNGRGMTEPVLVRAMTLGSKSPVEERRPEDLGRFGFGLKTASFSQCRRLTVGSKAEGGNLVSREWDLDFITGQGDWLLKKKIDEEAGSIFSRLDRMSSGTICLWRQVDRVIDAGIHKDDEKAHARFLRLVAETEEKLALIFHRFIAQKKPRILVNRREIGKIDPFLEGHDFSQYLPEERLSSGVKVRGFVLPHESRLNEDAKKEAGPGGWASHQGFYIYRNDRLLMEGGWLGLGFSRDEQFKLARIAVDLPNSVDAEWDIDIKKSRARPPSSDRDRLRRIAALTRERARQTFRSRGKILSRIISPEFAFVWFVREKEGKIGYRINRDHPAIKGFLDQARDRKMASAVLRLIEESLPLEQMWSQLSESSGLQRTAFEFDRDIEDIMGVVRDVVVKDNLAPAEIEEKLLQIEPFNQFPELVKKIAGLGEFQSGRDEDCR